MANKEINAKILSRIDTLTNWNTKNPILSKGEIGIISDINEIRIGDGSTKFTNLKGTSIGGNAGSANKLATSRTISLSGDVTGSSSFDGSKNVSITATVADNSHNHTISNVTGLQSALDGKASTSTATTSASGLMSSTDKAKLDGIAANANNYSLPTASTSTLGGVKVDGSSITISNGVISSPNQTTITGNAGSATKLQNARTITLSGDVTGSVSFDGSNDVTITSTVADNSHNHTIANVTNLQSRLNAKAPLASPALTGTPTAPTASASTNNTQIATTAYVNTVVNNKIAAADAMIYKGTIGTSGTITALPDTHSTGWTYKVITAGTYAGQKCEVGDMIVCLTDGTTATDSHWTVIQTNIDGAVTGPASAVSGRIATFDGTTGKVIKDSGYTIATSVPSGAKFTDTTYSAGTGLELSGTTFSNSGVRSVTAGASANQLTVNTGGTSKTITINNVANATTATAANKIVASGVTALTANSSVQDFMNFCIIASGGTVS